MVVIMKHPENENQIRSLIEEVILTFRRLRVVSAEIHGGGAPIPGQRGVLIELLRTGPQTVPAMARTRGVSRQNIQVLVDRFRSRGLIELEQNPAHRRSKLVRLTRNGASLVKTMNEREGLVLRSLKLAISPAQFQNATAVLRAFRARLEEHPWENRRQRKTSGGKRKVRT